jgi:hypothetical protein
MQGQMSKALGRAEEHCPGITEFLRNLKAVPIWCDFAGAEAPVFAAKDV